MLGGRQREGIGQGGKELYVLETTTIPGMTETSLVPWAARTAGMSVRALLDRLIELSLEDGN